MGLKNSDIKLWILTLLFVTGCGSSLVPTDAVPQAPLQSYSSKGSNFRVSLTDAPAKQLKSVFVNVESVELWLTKAGRSGRLVVGKNLGMVDLMTLRNGVLLPIQDVTIPAGAAVSEIRLLIGSGNYAVKSNGSICKLQTPSGQTSGVKIKIKSPVTVEDNFNYSLVVDFDAEKSVVLKGNGDCLLKPVLKIAGFTRVPQENVDDDGGEISIPGEDLTDGNEDSNIGGDTGGSIGGDTGGSIGGDTGGSIGGDTGGSIGGDTGGSIGGDTGGSIGGDTGGWTVVPQDELPPVIIDPMTL